ncbi:hypothetical protein SAMN05443574_12826 [Haloarcula vallismortis]|uniref:Uncharacterized protein n=1 Tax=Haloarcula vallismortis TaxID=28442 RepID=A0A1H3AQF8_HALVA|nr:hypothetical protein SAMN05443574_12826 [Haloarcula vallismortis]
MADVSTMIHTDKMRIEALISEVKSATQTIQSTRKKCNRISLRQLIIVSTIALINRLVLVYRIDKPILKVITRDEANSVIQFRLQRLPFFHVDNRVQNLYLP